MSRARWLTPNSAAGGDLCRVLHIPPELVEIVSAALDGMTDPANYEPDGDMTPEDTASLAWSMLQNYPEDCVSMTLQTQWFMSPPAASWLTANNGVLTAQNDSASLYGGHWFLNPAYQNDIVQLAIPLAAGAYRFFCYARKHPGSAIGHIWVNGDNIASFDLYASAGTPNSLFFTPSFTVPDGMCNIEVKATSKNGASNGYFMILQAFWVQLQP